MRSDMEDFAFIAIPAGGLLLLFIQAGSFRWTGWLGPILLVALLLLLIGAAATTRGDDY